jgi:putative ABC transport system substrate-binding protein
MAVSGDADRTGLIQNLARPGGNVTGLTYFAAEQTSKRLELMKDVIPSCSRVAFLVNPENPLMRWELEATENAAEALKIVFQPFEVRAPTDFDDAFLMIVKSGFDAVEIVQDGMLVANAGTIAAAALKNRIPAVGEAHFAKAGGLIGFGPNLPGMFQRAAYYVDRLLKGEKAPNLPVERPTKFDLIINLKTAKSLGITVPGTVIARATR